MLASSNNERLYLYLLYTPPTLLVLLSLGGVFKVFIGAIIFIALFFFCFLPSFNIILGRLLKFNIYSSHLLGYILLLITHICYARGVINGTIDFFKAFSLCVIWLILLISYSHLSKHHSYHCILWKSIIFYVILNLVLWSVGVSAPINAYSETGDAKLLSLIGLNINRVQFPITLGINGFGVIAGLASVLSFVYVLDEKNWLSVFSFASCLLVLLMTDSRGAFASFLLSSACVFLIYIIRKPFVYKIVGAMFILAYPFLSIVFYSIAIYLIGELSGLSRSGGGILSGREVIWESIFNFIHTANITNLLFGYGDFGQVVSGVSQSYFRLFEHLDNIDPERVNVHSSFFQLVLDMGLIGLLAITGILIKLLYISSKQLSNGNLYALYGFAFVFYGVIAGATDLTFNQNNLIFFCVLLGVSMFSVRSADNYIS